MTQPSNKFESLLELLINEENDKAEQLFHDIVVEKSRDIYENLADTESKDETVDETKDETKEETKDEAVKETEASDEKKDEEVKETEEDKPAEEKIKDEGVFTKAPVAPQKSDEESIEEIGGDATDQLVKDISSDEEGEADAAVDAIAPDMDADNGEGGEGDTEERVSDLEDALDELKAEFEKMMGGDGEEDNGEEEALSLAPEVAPLEASRLVPNMEAKAEPKETVKEYKIQKSADNADKSDSKKSTVASSNKPINSANSKEILKKSSEDTGRAAPTTEKMVKGEVANTGGKDSRKLSNVKVDNKDGADASAKKSPVNSRK
jgi:hypothetical protein